MTNLVQRIVAILFVLAVVQRINAQTDYCDRSLCKNNFNRTRRAAKRTNYGPFCPGKPRSWSSCPRTIQKYILDLHNQFRSIGGPRGRASAMRPPPECPTLIWSEELQKLAEYNVKTCIYGHDYCRNTPEFPLVGQNIAANSFYGMEVTPLDPMTELLYSCKDIGHFTQIMMDKAVSIGCAMIQYTQNEQGHDWVHQNYVCNYSNSIARGHPVYNSGKTCSLCQTGCSEEYPGLCNVGEQVEPTKT
ncbi:hypothetical protein quinque_010120 [Culex quinquefasciatus]